MFGAPPNCRPECVIHQDCPPNRACIRQRCEDPCIGACGFNAVCSAQNHRPTCSCIEGHEGDPYAGCNLRQSEYRAFFFFASKNFSICWLECIILSSLSLDLMFIFFSVGLVVRSLVYFTPSSYHCMFIKKLYVFHFHLACNLLSH